MLLSHITLVKANVTLYTSTCLPKNLSFWSVLEQCIDIRYRLFWPCTNYLYTTLDTKMLVTSFSILTYSKCIYYRLLQSIMVPRHMVSNKEQFYRYHGITTIHVTSCKFSQLNCLGTRSGRKKTRSDLGIYP